MANKEHEANKRLGNPAKINETLEGSNYLNETIQLPTSLIEQIKIDNLGDTKLFDLLVKKEVNLHINTKTEINSTGEKEPAGIKAPIIAETVNKTHQPGILQTEEGPVTLFNRYTYHSSENLIGKGGFSKVYKAYDSKLNRYVALKIYKEIEFAGNYKPIAEIKKVTEFSHPNICRYFDIEEIEQKNPAGKSEKIQVCIMELLDNGNLEEYYKANKSQLVLKKLLEDILNGLSYLHKKGIIHRDIKPSNILIKENTEGPIAKIADFGISEITNTLKNDTTSTIAATIPYLAPEQLDAKKYGINESISFNLDLWYLGVTMYEVLTGDVLFKNNEQEGPEQIVVNILSPGLPEKINTLPEPFKNIVSHCIVKNAQNRSQKAEDLLALLNSHNDSINLIGQKVETKEHALSLNELTENHINIFDVEEGKQNVEPILPIKKEVDAERVLQKKQLSANPRILNHTEIKTKKNKPDRNFKKPIIAAVVILLICSIFFIKKIHSNSLAASVENNNIVETNRKPIDDSAVLPSSSQLTQKANFTQTTLSKKKPVKKNNPGQKKLILPAGQKTNSTPKEDAIVNTGNTNDAQQNTGNCTLVLTATEACTIRIKSLDYGNLDAGSPMSVSIPVGKCFIEATSIKGNKDIAEIITVPASFSNKTYTYTIRFR